MKTFYYCIALFLVSLHVTQAQNEASTQATFDGWDNGTYYFIDEKDEVIEFESIDSTVLKKFNLKDEKFIGKLFLIEYKTVTQKDEYEIALETHKIINLTIIK